MDILLALGFGVNPAAVLAGVDPGCVASRSLWSLSGTTANLTMTAKNSVPIKADVKKFRKEKTE